MDAPNCRRIVLRAVVTTSESSETMNEPTDASARTQVLVALSLETCTAFLFPREACYGAPRAAAALGSRPAGAPSSAPSLRYRLPDLGVLGLKVSVLGYVLQRVLAEEDQGLADGVDLFERGADLLH